MVLDAAEAGGVGEDGDHSLCGNGQYSSKISGFGSQSFQFQTQCHNFLDIVGASPASAVLICTLLPFLGSLKM